MTTTTASAPQPGDFFITATSGPLIDRIAAWAIRFDTDSPVNHAGIYVGGGRIIEAVRTVRIGSIEQYPDAIWSSARLPAALTPSVEQRTAIVEAAYAMLGDRYNWADILAIGLAQHRTGHLVDDHTWWARRLSTDGREICSQLVDEAYRRAGIQLFADGRLSGLVSPGDLYRLLTPVPQLAA